jgi:hypothetical protein
MTFQTQIKRVTRKSTVSNDVEYEVLLVTEQTLAELMQVQADELVEVEIK